MEMSNNVKYLGGFILLMLGIYVSIRMMNRNMNLIEGLSKNEEAIISDNLYKKMEKLEKRVKDKKSRINLDDYSDDLLKIIDLEQENAALDIVFSYCMGGGGGGLMMAAMSQSDGVDKLKKYISGGSEGGEGGGGGGYW